MLFETIAKYQKIRIEKLLQAWAGFFKQKYGIKEVIINLKWLLIDERKKWPILKKAYNVLTEENMPKNIN